MATSQLLLLLLMKMKLSFQDGESSAFAVTLEPGSESAEAGHV